MSYLADFTDISTIYGCTFDTCDFSSARLNGVTMRDCGFLSCNFKYADFFGAKFDDCKMTGSNFTNAESLSQIEGGDWSYTVLRFLEFSKQLFDGTRFSGADLTGSRFIKCIVKNCDFDGIYAHETSFLSSDLRTSSFSNVDFSGLNLKNAKVDAQMCVTIAEALTDVKYTPKDEAVK